MKLLLIDDDENSLKMLQNALILNGYECTACLNPVDALEYFKNNNYDFLISDIKMPGFSGWEFLEAVLSINKRTKVILYSGNSDDKISCEAIKKGAYKFLAKPINWLELKDILQKV